MTAVSVLSIDVGRKNLGWAFFGSEIDFGLFNIDEKCKAVSNGEVSTARCAVIKRFFKSIIDIYGTPDFVIIERQVPNNAVCCCLMYSIITEAQEYSRVQVIPAWEKFKTFGVKYTTKNKEHKKLSVKMAEELLGKKIDLPKKDDIADAVLQGAAYVKQHQIKSTCLVSLLNHQDLFLSIFSENDTQKN